VGNKVPIDILRLRSASTAYASILRDTLPMLEVLVAAEPPDLPNGLLAQLRDSVQAALGSDATYGTTSHILATLAVLLGEA
jgi:hypothetical protein